MKKEKKRIETQLAATPIMDQPQDAFEMVNKYGTYEIQPTSDSGNAFPEIAQGQPHKPGCDKSLIEDK